MRRFLIIGGIFVLGLSSFLATLFFTYIPGQAEKKAQRFVAESGFGKARLPEPERKAGWIIYRDIALDEDGFSTIAEMKIHYGLLDTLVLGRIHALHLRGLKLTGEITESLTPGITLSGHNGPFDLRTLPFERIVLEDSQLSLLTENYGGLFFSLNGQARRKGGAYEVQANINSGQNWLSFESKMNGLIGPERWNADFEILQAKFNIPFLDMKATRMNGWMNISGDRSTPTKITSEMRAGGFQIMGMPWQNTSIALELVGGVMKLFSESRSLGDGALEFLLNIYRNHDAPPLISGEIHAEEFKALDEYLAGWAGLEDREKILPIFGNARNISLPFEISGSNTNPPQNIRLNIRNINQNIDIKGILSIKESDVIFNFSSDPLFLKAVEGVFRRAEDEGTHALHYIHQGTGVLSGSVAYNAEKKAVSNSVALDIRDAGFGLPWLRLDGISGNFELNDKGNLETGSTAPLKCSLSIRQSLAHTCSLKAHITPDEVVWDNVKIGIFGGTASLAKDRKLKFANIKTVPLLKALKIEGLSSEGQISGTLEFDKNLGINEGTLRNTDPGTIRWTGALPDFIEGDELERETIAMALKNFHYRTLEIQPRGNIRGKVETRFMMTGGNPDILNGNEMTLSFTANIDPKELLAPFLQ